MELQCSLQLAGTTGEKARCPLIGSAPLLDFFAMYANLKIDPSWYLKGVIWVVSGYQIELRH